MTRIASFVACVLLAVSASAHADFEGVVQHVSDGDTIWVRPERGGAALAVRILGIDAPELCQPGGPAAKEALAARLLRQRVRVDVKARDDYDRLVARVESKGEDVGRWLVREGHAWSDAFRGSKGPYAREEQLARQARMGLWGQRDPMEPRVFRRFNGPCRTDAA